MLTLKTKALFKEIAEEIKEIESTELKLIRLLKILEIEYEKNKNLNLLSSVDHGLVEMLDEMKKIEIISEINMSIRIIDRYQESKKFDLIVIPNAVSYDFKEKFELLNTIIKSMILVE
jgi:HJR/Mrr/RecB family endonuclease